MYFPSDVKYYWLSAERFVFSSQVIQCMYFVCTVVFYVHTGHPFLRHVSICM